MRQEFAEEQELMAKLMHQLRSEDADETFSVLKAAKERIAQSGPARLKHTLPPLAFCALSLTEKVKAHTGAGERSESSCKTVRLPSASMSAVARSLARPASRTTICTLLEHRRESAPSMGL